ncbi:amino acid permease [Corynebacterium coyleae]|uniref:amino acid permease n=1 Tax=Corynebacterium coyleae TaxID=53374 RepID=UPI00254B9F26|nr:amino acid permease [Corynebacterium coyleae]MDK8663208.1 amino acid permease [Corynebacterium coyleae]MDK8706446.1 amino acid permease [Corynebacterium coyleae]MDK8733163.1 amino acid permease [Corynebacterium coyleae]MDK8892488.1 amino acid permease [Corynebacterium coyleae]
MTAPTQQDTPKPKRPGLTARHIHFIALGSAIGTGLFYGSAGAIQAAGPSVLLVYLLGGAVMYFILRALGEMSVRHPVRGSFAVYCREYLGGLGGYITGWMFAFEMMIVCLADLTAITIYMKFWFPTTPAWVWITVTLLIISAANLAAVRLFGELEFMLTLIKVGAVVAMIIGGAAILIFNLGESPEAMGIDNLWNDGGFFANGFSGMAASFILVLFAFGGTEIIGVAGAEAEDPDRSIPKAVNTVPMRILIFYVLSILVILMINPWRTINGDDSPFVQIFDTLGVSWAAALLNVVVLSASLSAINADLFSTGRVLAGLAKENLAPKSMARTYRDVPVMTVAMLIVALIVGVYLNQRYPDIFGTIAALATFATIFVWLMILIAHIASRREMTAQEVKDLKFPVPFWPYGQWFAVAFILFTFGTMVWLPEYHVALAVGVGFLIVMTILYFVTGRPQAVAETEYEYEAK